MFQICSLDKLALKAKERVSSEETSFALGDNVRVAYVVENGWSIRLVKREHGYHIAFRTEGVLYENETLSDDEKQVIDFLRNTEEAIEACRLAYDDID